MDAAERARIRDEMLMDGSPTRELVLRLLDALDAAEARIAAVDAMVADAVRTGIASSTRSRIASDHYEDDALDAAEARIEPGS